MQHHKQGTECVKAENKNRRGDKHAVSVCAIHQPQMSHDCTDLYQGDKWVKRSQMSFFLLPSRR